MDIKASPIKSLFSTHNLFFENVKLENIRKELSEEISTTKKLILNFYKENILPYDLKESNTEVESLSKLKLNALFNFIKSYISNMKEKYNKLNMNMNLESPKKNNDNGNMNANDNHSKAIEFALIERDLREKINELTKKLEKVQEEKEYFSLRTENLTKEYTQLDSDRKEYINDSKYKLQELLKENTELKLVKIQFDDKIAEYEQKIQIRDNKLERFQQLNLQRISTEKNLKIKEKEFKETIQGIKSNHKKELIEAFEQIEKQNEYIDKNSKKEDFIQKIMFDLKKMSLDEKKTESLAKSLTKYVDQIKVFQADIEQKEEENQKLRKKLEEYADKLQFADKKNESNEKIIQSLRAEVSENKQDASKIKTQKNKNKTKKNEENKLELLNKDQLEEKDKIIEELKNKILELSKIQKKSMLSNLRIQSIKSEFQNELNLIKDEYKNDLRALRNSIDSRKKKKLEKLAAKRKIKLEKHYEEDSEQEEDEHDQLVLNDPLLGVPRIPGLNEEQGIKFLGIRQLKKYMPKKNNTIKRRILSLND